MRIVAGDARQVTLTASITSPTSQATLAARQVTLTPSGGTAYTYSGALTRPTGSGAALDNAAIADPSFTPDVPGSYVVTITATDTASGATVTRSSTLEVRSPLSISLSSTSSTQDNLNAVSTTVTPTGGLGTITYSATLTPPTGGTTTVTGPTTTTPSFTPDRAGGWRLTVTATDAAGQTATTTRLVEVGTSALSVSIGAISDQTAATGTINCDATVSGGLGSLSYAWTGEGPDGAALSFADPAAANTTLTLSASKRPGNYTVTVTVTDSARAQTARATVTFRVGTATGWVTGYTHDYTADGNETISGSPWGDWTVLNVANASTFAIVAGTGLRIIASTGTLNAGTRTPPGISRAISGLASMYAAGRRVGVHVQIGAASAVGASQRKIGALFEDVTTPIGDGGTTERGGGVLWRNNGGTIQVAGLMCGLSSGSALVQNARPTTETAPRVLAFERSDWTFRVGHSTSTAAWGDPAHASWVWSEYVGIDYTGTADKLVPATDLLTIFAACDAASAGAQIDLEKLWVGVQW
jgi:hypothetical protein